MGEGTQDTWSVSLLRLLRPHREGGAGPTTFLPHPREGPGAPPGSYSGVLLLLFGDQMLDKRNLGFFLCSPPLLCRSGGQTQMGHSPT